MNETLIEKWHNLQMVAHEQGDFEKVGYYQLLIDNYHRVEQLSDKDMFKESKHKKRHIYDRK